jgi:SAM-dependent methyltransferase
MLIHRGETLICKTGCLFPIVTGIPRLVASNSYASSFGLQWNAYRTTQLDSNTNSKISYQRLSRCLGDSLETLKGKSVLEAGCGAGRFTEVLLSAGAKVCAFDLSSAVDANLANCRHLGPYFLCQANILDAPFSPRSFDYVFCIGVIQHTPNPEQTIATLSKFVKPGGMLVIDHYRPHSNDHHQSHTSFSRRLARHLLLKSPPDASFEVVKGLCRALIPLHRALRPPQKWRGQTRLRGYLLRVSPVIDYYDDLLNELPLSTAEIWMELDTHDALTDYYKHFRTRQQIETTLLDCGMIDVVATDAGNGVEARARRP